MNIYLFDEDKTITFSLPLKKIGDFWMTDSDGKNIVNISGQNDNWVLSGSDGTSVSGYTEGTNVLLRNKNYYVIEKKGKKYILYTDDLADYTYKAYSVPDGSNVKVGKNPGCNISASSPYLLDVHIALIFQGGKWIIQKGDKTVVYVNNLAIEGTNIQVHNGDVVGLFGLNLVLAQGVIFVNNPLNNTRCTLENLFIKVDDPITPEELPDDNMYSDDDYFLRSPRMQKFTEQYQLKIDTPPAKENMQETPIWVTLAPMLTMAASTMVTLTTAIQTIINGEKTFTQLLPTIIISVAMISSVFVWPFVTKNFEKKQKLIREEERIQKYRAYLEFKKRELFKEFDSQKKNIVDSLTATNVCYDAILNKRRTLWERKLDQIDFLTARIGVGEAPFNAAMNYASEGFTLDDDNLRKMCDTLIHSFDTITDVPIGYSFADSRLTAINGVYPKYVNLMHNILLQFMAFHSYTDLKIVVFTSNKNMNRWNYLKDAPYCFTNGKEVRFFATTTEEMQEISDYLKKIYDNRDVLTKNGNNDEKARGYADFDSYYLLLIDNIDVARKISIVDSVLKGKKHLGFSIIVLEERLSKVPSEVTNFITIGESQSVILRNGVNTPQRFTDEIRSDYDMEKCVSILANLPLYLDRGGSGDMKNTITFLELFGVGQIEQLNVMNRWKEKDPTKSLKTEIGVNENNDPFILDLHEKAHGPHGLVAGMTGSGKSEFLITYILSMAINYSPEEVAFVLIDYKGGGLAGAFENEETGAKLPHVVGTITNLDKAEINRALSSIQSELRRRQLKFNEVRDKFGESSVDIYKYQKLYRDGAIDEPIPHLIIVSDEFAELKDQQPDFMEDLVSTARIGRSLGVHLILATQKPSGVVDSQIWSNSKFKICLKVQDKADSMEMIKNDLAAELKNVGRFYLQVGYNEYFAMGQSAWAGAQYYPSKEYKRQVDKNLYFIDNVGYIKKSINNAFAKRKVQAEGEEVTSIVKYLTNICSDGEYKIRKLWLDKIPAIILVDDLYKKYNFKKNDFDINPVYGEFDDPTNQLQGVLTLPITREGNVVVYGVADAGKDEFLSTVVYSIIKTYTSEEIFMYLLDFGAETLMNFRDAPQVGNVVLNGYDEELNNLIKYLNSEMNKRKKLFLAYNGNYIDYIKNSGSKLPTLLVAINSIEVLTEVYQDYADKLTPLIREGSKYGINFIITTTSQNTVKFKIAQSCKQQICLQLKAVTDYRDILGKTEGVIPSSILGRGVLRLEKVCEFQTAMIAEENSFQKVSDLVKEAQSKNMPKARPIPVMPETVSVTGFMHKYTGLDSVPFGLGKESLTAYTFDFTKSVASVISANDMDTMINFTHNLMRVFEMNSSFNKVVIDADNMFETFNYKINLINSNFDAAVDSLKVVDDKIQSILQDNNMNTRSLKELPNNFCIIIGVGKFLNKLDEDHKNAFIQILLNQRDALKMNFLFIDVPSAFKKYEYDEWYKTCINLNEGLWIGKGVTQQYLLKTLIQPSGISNIEKDYGVVIKNGMPTIIKLINEVKVTVK